MVIILIIRIALINRQVNDFLPQSSVFLSLLFYIFHVREFLLVCIRNLMYVQQNVQIFYARFDEKKKQCKICLTSRIILSNERLHVYICTCMNYDNHILVLDIPILGTGIVQVFTGTFQQPFGYSFKCIRKIHPSISQRSGDKSPRRSIFNTLFLGKNKLKQLKLQKNKATVRGIE